MKLKFAIKHILQLCQAYQGFLHWQITARVALGSLYLDSRITEEVRDEIANLIANGKLLDYDHLLDKPFVSRD